MKQGIDGNRLTQKNAYAGGDGKRFVVQADELLTAFLELESAIRAGQRCCIDWSGLFWRR
jgi:hypothetical protein